MRAAATITGVLSILRAGGELDEGVELLARNLEGAIQELEAIGYVDDVPAGAEDVRHHLVRAGELYFWSLPQSRRLYLIRTFDPGSVIKPGARASIAEMWATYVRTGNLLDIARHMHPPEGEGEGDDTN